MCDCQICLNAASNNAIRIAQPIVKIFSEYKLHGRLHAFNTLD